MIPSSDTFVLSLDHIEKSFGGVRALSGAHLHARKGEILGLCGENGAGKSTLLKVLSGVYPHGTFAGEIKVNGNVVHFGSTLEARDAGIGIVHQELMLIPALTVAQNLALGREDTSLGILSDDALEKRAHDLLVRFGVRDVLDPRAPLRDLGVGLWQVVEIVRALGDGGSILILDEPTAALAAHEAEKLFGWLRELAKAGTTCVYVSHRMDEVFALCDRVTVLRDGKTVGTVEIAASSPEEVVSMMVGGAVSTDRTVGASKHARSSVLAVSHLSLTGANSQPILQDISLSVNAGEIVALAGAMGSGRTALLSCLFGAARGIVAGEIRLVDLVIAPKDPAHAIGLGIALVPEDRKHQGVVLGLSITENLALVRGKRPDSPWSSSWGAFWDRLGFIDAERDEVESRKRISELRIRGESASTVGNLSGGNQQKVAVGKWLAHPPKLLLLDEPTRGVDIGAREEIYSILEELLRQGTAILFASSDPAEVERLAERVVVLRQGRVVASLTHEEATQQRIVLLTTGAGSTALVSNPPEPEVTTPCNP